jgi:hypothetical protein
MFMNTHASDAMEPSMLQGNKLWRVFSTKHRPYRVLLIDLDHYVRSAEKSSPIGLLRCPEYTIAMYSIEEGFASKSMQGIFLSQSMVEGECDNCIFGIVGVYY